MAENDRPRVVTLLLNFKTAELTLRCLAQLVAASASAGRVLLMDNGSGAEEEEILRAGVRGQDGVELRLLRANYGYCAAMNQGIEWARSEGVCYVLFLNNDVEVEPGFLEPLVAVLDNDASVAGVGPTVLQPDGRVWCQGAEVAFGPNLTRLRGLGRAPAPRSLGPREVGYLPGACVLYRLEDLHAVRNLEESYFMYFEDAHLGHALRQTGKKILWLPWGRVVHTPSSSSGGGRSPMRKFSMAVNALRYLRSHFSVRLWAAFFLFECLGLPLAYVTGGVRTGWAKTLGIFCGLRGHQVNEADVARWTES